MSIQRRSTPYFTPPGPWGRQVLGIVLHSTETAVRVDPHQQGSWHYEIDRDGVIYAYVGEDQHAWHCYAWGFDPRVNRNRPAWLPAYQGGISAVNQCTVGIELVGYAAKGFTAEQYLALGELCADVCARHGIPASLLPDHGADARITTHGWLQTDRTDPGPHFDWDVFRAALGAAGADDTEAEGEDMAQIALLEGEVAHLNGVNTELQRQVDALREMLGQAHSTIGALEHDVLPALRAAAGAAGDGAAERVAELEAVLAQVRALVTDGVDAGVRAPEG